MNSLKLTVLLLAVNLFITCDINKNNTDQLSMTKNPLLTEWETPFGVPPFNAIKNKHYLPAIKEGINSHQKEIDVIVNNKEEPNFVNIIEAIELSGVSLKRARNVFNAVNAAHTNDTLKATAKEIAPLLASHRDNIMLNAKLFEKVKVVYEQKNSLQLSKEQNKLLEETYENFVRAGAAVPDTKKPRLREINARLATLSQAFGENVLNETNSFELYVENEKDLGNLSEGSRANAAAEAKKRGHENGWSFTLQRPSVNPFLVASPNRELRETIFNGYAMRGDNDNDNDNKKIISETAKLRTERAQLLGYNTHAEFVLSKSMAKKPESVMSFLDQLWTPALEMAKKEREALAKYMKSEGVKGEFKASDWRYYVEKVRKERYDFDENETRPYFEVNAVVQGAFTLANKLFGIKFNENKTLPRWHPEQKVYEVLEADGKHIGILYMDFFARESKRGGAWMNELRYQSKKNGNMVTPVVTNNFNFPAPSANTPSLLTFSQAQTVFHEFGHGLHGLFSNVTYESLSGTNVPRDFVEFPSQIMENWVGEPEFLKLYAKHYQTGEVIPMELIEKMNRANQFNQGFYTVEYMAASYLDMAWHTLSDTNINDVVDFENKTLSSIGLIDEIISRYRSTYFQHIFSGGYSSGYYSYLWSEVLDSDGFQAFKESGDIFNPEIAKKYRSTISQGGTVDGMDLYKQFRGREPEMDALLKKKGFQ